MKYEFHVGDYVENKNGSIGCIVKIEKTIPYWEITKRSDIDVNMGTYCTSIQYPITLENIDFGSYARIGQYDFTKKNKIKSLDKSYIESFPIFKTQDAVTGKVYEQKCYSIDLGVISGKINELVEAVNRLEDKV